MVTPSTQASGSKQVWDPQPHERQETLLINCLYTVFCAPNETAFSKADVKNGILETLVVNSVPNWIKKKRQNLQGQMTTKTGLCGLVWGLCFAF